jgi:hypothetical protein
MADAGREVGPVSKTRRTGKSARPPATFIVLQSLVRIHLNQILKLDQITTKVPMHAVALLVVIAYEALSRFLHPRRGPEYLFAQEHQRRHNIPVIVGATLFDVLRNGLAHKYGPYPVKVSGLGLVRLQLTWKDGAVAHFRGVSIRRAGIHQHASRFPKGSTVVPRNLCVNVESLWKDLDAVFANCEKRLTKDSGLAVNFDRNVRRNRAAFTRTVSGNAAPQWRAFLIKARLEKA